MPYHEFDARHADFGATMFRAVLMISVFLFSTATGNAETPPNTAWTLSLVAHIEKFKRFPLEAHGATGTTRIKFVIDSKGRLIDNKVATSSCYNELDQEALATIRRAAPFPQLPPEIKTDRAEFILPLTFRDRLTGVATSKTDCLSPEPSQERDKALGLHPPS